MKILFTYIHTYFWINTHCEKMEEKQDLLFVMHFVFWNSEFYNWKYFFISSIILYLLLTFSYCDCVSVCRWWGWGWEVCLLCSSWWRSSWPRPLEAASWRWRLSLTVPWCWQTLHSLSSWRFLTLLCHLRELAVGATGSWVVIKM